MRLSPKSRTRKPDLLLLAFVRALTIANARRNREALLQNLEDRYRGMERD